MLTYDICINRNQSNKKGTHKILLDFFLYKMDRSISAWRLDLALVNEKKKNSNCGFCYSNWQSTENETKWEIDKYLGLVKELKNCVM